MPTREYTQTLLVTVHDIAHGVFVKHVVRAKGVILYDRQLKKWNKKKKYYDTIYKHLPDHLRINSSIIDVEEIDGITDYA